jgi:hypothetical protein
MRLLVALSTAIFLTACASAPKELAIPPNLEGGWKLTATKPTEAVYAPDWMTKLGRKASRTAAYNGPIDTLVDFHELASDASALEATQLWRRQTGQQYFHLRNHFIVVRSSHPNKEMAMDFTRALQKALQ